MVYCGKASQGCQLCRTRRIKCDKVKPECSQCVRVGKKCPGYRDQLSLMFRDESSKVIQKAHAQWGTAGSPDAAHSTDSASWTSSSSPVSGIRSPGSTGSPSAAAMEVVLPNIPSKVEPNMDQRGIQFFMDHYLMGQPDAPVDTPHLEIYSGNSVAMQHVMIAVGLAGLSNVQGDRAMNLLSRQKYTTALQSTGQLIASRYTAKSPDPRTILAPLTAVVMLALFEVVQGKGSKLSTGTANIHIFGAVALLRSALPLYDLPGRGARAVLQIMFSLYIPSQLSETPLPPAFFECLSFCRGLLCDAEKCGCDLAVAIARYLQMSVTARRMDLQDGLPSTDATLQQLLGMDAVLARLEEQLRVGYPYTEEAGDFPKEAVFRGRYHIYSEIWEARIWNHMRWVRILVVQDIIKLSNDRPLSSSRVLSTAQRNQCFATAQRMAEDILVSTPCHWHHPILGIEQAKQFAAGGRGGSGAAGVPTLLWHLKIAGCAPGVSQDIWDWAYAIMQVVWRDMGMQHAFALKEVMDGHRTGQEKEAIERVLKLEEEDWVGVDTKVPAMSV